MKPAKISSILLYVVLGITLVVLIVFYMGGTELSDSGNMVPAKTPLLLDWMYLVLASCIVASGVFFVMKSVQTFRTNPRTFWRNFIVFFGIVILLTITWFTGSGQPLVIDSYHGQANTFFWLKLTDMFLYAIYALLALTILFIFGMYVYQLVTK